MKRESLISMLFYAATVYDAVLGLAFLFAAPAVFEWFGVTPPITSDTPSFPVHF